MIYVTSAEWNRLEESLGATNLRTCMRHEHEGKVCMGGERMIRKGYLTKKSEDFSALVFEHIHFEVMDRVHMLKYFKKSKGVNTPKVEVSYDEALSVLLGSFRDNDMTRDMLTIPNNILCAYSTIYVEDHAGRMPMVLMAGLYNQLPIDVEYDEDGNHM